MRRGPGSRSWRPCPSKFRRPAWRRARTFCGWKRSASGTIPGRPLVSGLDLAITGPERLAVTGPNGAGKSTLLAVMVGSLEPLAGVVRRLVPTAFLDQTVSVLRPEETILGNFRRLNPDSDENACRAALARFRFRADAALQPVASLSGGQRLRAGLACVLGGAHPPALLILDEPTNHLDLDSIEAMESGLAAYDGALVLVSHDEAFLRAIGIGRSLDLAPGQAAASRPDPCVSAGGP
jgi:ATPase subunit of ABC transporter with duplicated ATPase domains